MDSGKQPKGQRFATGDEVYIRPIYEHSKSHFNSDVITYVKYSYYQKYGDGSKDSYATGVASWYDECELMPVNGRSIEECRKACEDYFCMPHEEMIRKKEESLSEWCDFFDPDGTKRKKFRKAIANAFRESALSVKEKIEKPYSLEIGDMVATSNYKRSIIKTSIDSVNSEISKIGEQYEY